MIKTYPHDLKSARRNGHVPSAAIIPDELPPHSIEAERGALGCVFCTTNVHEMDELLLRMKPRHFYDVRHRTICEEMHKMRMAHHAIDLVLLAEWLTDHKLLESVGGIGYLAELPDATPSLHNFDAYIEILAEKLARRQMFALANEIRERAGQTEFDLDRARERVTELMESTGKATGEIKLINIITPKEARAYTPDPASFLVGEGLIAREQFITIGGEPGCGKSRQHT